VAEAQKAYQQAVGDRAQVVEATEKLKAAYVKEETALLAKHKEDVAARAKAVDALAAEYWKQADEIADSLSHEKAGYESRVAEYKGVLADYEARIEAAKVALAALKGA
jgi:hypothetical protein